MSQTASPAPALAPAPAPAPAPAAPGIGATLAADASGAVKGAEAAVGDEAAQEVSFFVAHPKAIAIGAGVAGFIAGGAVDHFTHLFSIFL